MQLLKDNQDQSFQPAKKARSRRIDELRPVRVWTFTMTIFINLVPQANNSIGHPLSGVHKVEKENTAKIVSVDGP